MPAATAAPTTAAALALALLLAGCGSADESSDGEPSASGSATGASPSPTSTEVSGEPDLPPSVDPDLSVEVAQGAVAPPPGVVEVAVGEPFVLRLLTDADDELHAHGTTAEGGGEVEVPVPGGEPVEFELVWEQPGSYELELHDSGLLLAQVQVR